MCFLFDDFDSSADSARADHICLSRNGAAVGIIRGQQ